MTTYTDKPDARQRGHNYSERAEELRACAEAFRDPDCRATLFRLATSYDRMAVAADRMKEQH